MERMTIRTQPIADQKTRHIGTAQEDPHIHGAALSGKLRSEHI